MDHLDFLKMKRLVRYAVIVVRTAIIFFIRVFLWFYSYSLNLLEFNAKWKRHQRLPPIKSDLCKMSAVELRDLIMHKQLSSRQLMEQSIARILDVETVLNSVVDDRFEEALKEADKIDEVIREASETQIAEMFERKPLLGLPFTVKETLAVKGMKHSSARSRVPVKIAEEDADAVRRLRVAGAVPLLISNSPELCLNLETVSRNGRTLNPYDTTKSAGGSTGGEAALLGSGASVMGLGSDICGSLRLPAMFCGVFGHKPTPGLISVQGHIPNSTDPMWDYYFTVGPMVKRAVDLPLLFKAMVNENDIEKLRINEKVDLSTLKIYYMFGEGSESQTQTSPSPRIRAAIESAVENVKKVYKCDCEMIRIPYFINSLNYNRFIVSMKGVENVYQRTDEDPDDWDFWRVLQVIWRKITFKTDANFGALLWAPMQYMAQLAALIGPDDAELKLKEYKQQFYELLGDKAVLLYPPFPVEAQPHNFLTRFAFDVSYTSVFNVFGVPSTSCPIQVPGGLPVGIQIVAAPQQDRLCFAVAQALDETCGGWIPPE